MASAGSSTADSGVVATKLAVAAVTSGELRACVHRATAFGTCDRLGSLSVSPSSAANGVASNRCTSVGDGYELVTCSAMCPLLLSNDGKVAAEDTERGLLN